jgi:hypothetical protein
MTVRWGIANEVVSLQFLNPVQANFGSVLKRIYSITAMIKYSNKFTDSGEEAGCGNPGLVWLHVVCVCEAGWI